MSDDIDLQTAINRASLMQNLDNDVAKALTVAGMHPKLAEVFMTMHHQQKAMDEEIKSLRRICLQLAHTVNNLVDNAVNIKGVIDEIHRKIANEDVNPEEI